MKSVLIISFLINTLIVFGQGGTKITTANSNLPSNKVNIIYIDSSNVKWIGTDKGLARLKADVWTLYSTSNLLFNNNVNDIDYERVKDEKELWVATDSGLTVAAYNIDGITGSTTYVVKNSGLVENKVTNICVDINHNRWAATETAISVFFGDTWDNILKADDPNGEPFYLADNHVTDMVSYPFDDMAFATTAGKGILRLGYNEIDGITGASTYGAPWSAIKTNDIQAVDAKGEIQWYGTPVGAYLHASYRTKDSWYFYNTDSGLVSNDVSKLHIDKKDNIWFGTSSGLSIYNGTNWYKYTENEGLISNSINTIASDFDGNVWVGTNEGIEWFSEIPGVLVIPNSVNQPNQNKEFNLYPNPVENTLFVRTTLEKIQDLNISIYSASGKLISVHFNKYLNNKNQLISIDMSDKILYSAGVYIVNIKGTNFEQAIKINKQ